MPLPIEKSKVNKNLSDQIIMVYGRPKIGKSTFCSYFPDSLFLITEPLNHLEIHKVIINSWEKFLETCGEIANGKHKFKTIVIDTVDNLIELCSAYICEQNKIDHESELPHGKGWNLVTSELKRTLIKLGTLPYGLVLVSHSKQEEIETKVKKYNRWTIDVSGKKQNAIMNMMNIILFMDSEIRDKQEIGIVRTKPSMYWDAGDQLKILPEFIEYPLSEPLKAFKVISEAFNKANV